MPGETRHLGEKACRKRLLLRSNGFVLHDPAHSDQVVSERVTHEPDVEIIAEIIAITLGQINIENRAIGAVVLDTTMKLQVVLGSESLHRGEQSRPIAPCDTEICEMRASSFGGAIIGRVTTLLDLAASDCG